MAHTVRAVRAAPVILSSCRPSASHEAASAHAHALLCTSTHSQLLPLSPLLGATECHTEGDSFILAFHTAADAVACALEIQVRCGVPRGTPPHTAGLDVVCAVAFAHFHAVAGAAE